MATSNFCDCEFGIYAAIYDGIEYDEHAEDDNEGYYTEKSCFDHDAWELLEELAGELNRSDLMFHDAEVRQGYYDGCQIIIESRYNDVRSLSNEDCHNEFDLNRSQTIRKYDAEKRKISRFLDKAAKEHSWCITRLAVVARFSNGETIYEQQSS